jgi:RimJ/RimL family protein N-acetyltransferase
MVVLEGTKVRLRPLESGDLTRVFEWYGDPELVSPYDRYFTDTFESFTRSVGEAADDPLSLAPRFAIEPRSVPGVVGVVGSYQAHPVLETVEVWYLVGDPAARGHGYGQEAVGLLVDHLFRTTSIERVGVTCDVENAASVRLAEGLGFRREGTLRRAFYHHGRWHDAFQYGVNRSERPVPPPSA